MGHAWNSTHGLTSLHPCEDGEEHETKACHEFDVCTITEDAENTITFNGSGGNAWTCDAVKATESLTFFMTECKD